MVFDGVEDRDQDPHDALHVRALSGKDRWRRIDGGGVVAASQESAGKIADRGNDDGEMIAAVPESIVGRLIAEDLNTPPVSDAPFSPSKIDKHEPQKTRNLTHSPSAQFPPSSHSTPHKRK